MMLRTIVVFGLSLALSVGLNGFYPQSKASVNLASDFKTPPYFFRADQYSLLDGGKYLFVGTGLENNKDPVFHLLDTESLTRSVIKVHESISQKFGKGKIQRVIGYRSSDQTITLIWQQTVRENNKIYLLHGKLASGEVRSSQVLIQKQGNEFIGVTSTEGYQGSGPYPLAVYRLASISTKPIKLSRQAQVSLFLVNEDGTTRRYPDFRSQQPPHIVLTGKTRVFLTEYAEGHEGGDKPLGHIIELETGTRVTAPIDYVVYGLSFSADESRVYAASALVGSFFAYDAKTGAVLSRLEVGDYGHAMGLFDDHTLIWLRNAGIVRIGLSPGPYYQSFTPYTTYGTEIEHVERSFFQGKTLWVHDWNDLWRFKFE